MAHAQCIHVRTAHRWYREGTLRVPARKGRLISVSPDTAAVPPRAQGGGGLYARVSCHDQKAGLNRQAGRLPTWAEQAGLPPVRSGAGAGVGVGSYVTGSRPGVRRVLAGPACRWWWPGTAAGRAG